MKNCFELAVSDKGVSYLQYGHDTLFNCKNPSDLRQPATQRAYQLHKHYGGPNIEYGLVHNKFPYDRFLYMLGARSGIRWDHYVFATPFFVELDDLISVATSYLHQTQYLVFINEKKSQSQPHIPHGQIIVPAR